MSVSLAYTSRFHSLDNTRWDIAIFIWGDGDIPTREIKLEGDEPCVIDWQECSRADVVQSATCTLRVSNESDRQMVRLMTERRAQLYVYRNKKEYWRGIIDDTIYEEPYSYTRGYVTEIHFTDFGTINRLNFDLHGKQSVQAIVDHCLEGSGLDYLSQALCTSLLEPKTQQPITLDMLYLNADRFAAADSDSWAEKPTKRDVLEEVLRPLGLRIMQKSGQVVIYDIEYLRDHPEYQDWTVWQGADATLRGSENYGVYEVAFEPDADETLAETPENNSVVPENKYVVYFDQTVNDDVGEGGKGFFISFQPNNLNPWGMRFRTRSWYTSSDDHGFAWRAYSKWHPNQINDYPNLDNAVVNNIANAAALFSIATGYLPVSPDRGDYQMRVNLDLLLSLKANPLEQQDNSVYYAPYDSHLTLEVWRSNIVVVHVPVKLELLDDQGNVLMHYVNFSVISGNVYPCDFMKGEWKSGETTNGEFKDMMLSYYKDGMEDTPLDGWATNQQTIKGTRKNQPSVLRKRAAGEYVPLPPMPGIIRLTVSNCIHVIRNRYIFNNFVPYIKWQMYRDAKITLVKNVFIDDAIDTDTYYARDIQLPDVNERLSDSVKAGTWNKGIAPSARGLFFTASGIVWEKFTKNGNTRSLEFIRLASLSDQHIAPQPTLAGTVQLDPLWHAKWDRSTQGVFLVTALRQDLHQDTEEVTMVRIAAATEYYDYEWRDHICAMEEPPYTFYWEKYVCTKEQQEPYAFAWSGHVCAKQLAEPYAFAWSNHVCAKVLEEPYAFAWRDHVCAKVLEESYKFYWEKYVCAKQLAESYAFAWRDHVCLKKEYQGEPYTFYWEKYTCAKKDGGLQELYTFSWSSSRPVCAKRDTESDDDI